MAHFFSSADHRHSASQRVAGPVSDHREERKRPLLAQAVRKESGAIDEGVARGARGAVGCVGVLREPVNCEPEVTQKFSGDHVHNVVMSVPPPAADSVLRSAVA